MLYAGDIVFLIDGDTWQETQQNAEEALAFVLRWLSANLLTLNVKKSEYFAFAMISATLPSTTFTIKAHVSLSLYLIPTLCTEIIVSTTKTCTYVLIYKI